MCEDPLLIKPLLSLAPSANISPGPNGERHVSPVQLSPACADVCGNVSNLIVGFRGETALHKAAASCQWSICHYLVEAGASLMKTDLQVLTWNAQSALWRRSSLDSSHSAESAHSFSLLSFLSARLAGGSGGGGVMAVKASQKRPCHPKNLKKNLDFISL